MKIYLAAEADIDREENQETAELLRAENDILRNDLLETEHRSQGKISAKMYICNNVTHVTNGRG